MVCKTAIGGSNPPVASPIASGSGLEKGFASGANGDPVIGLGTLDLALSVFYSALFVLVVVMSYLSLSRRKSRS